MDQSKGKSDRGFVADIDEVRYASKSTGELIDLLKSHFANEQDKFANSLDAAHKSATKSKENYECLTIKKVLPLI